MISRLKEIAYDTVAQKFVARDQAGKKVVVPIGGLTKDYLVVNTTYAYKKTAADPIKDSPKTSRVEGPSVRISVADPDWHSDVVRVNNDCFLDVTVSAMVVTDASEVGTPLYLNPKIAFYGNPAGPAAYADPMVVNNDEDSEFAIGQSRSFAPPAGGSTQIVTANAKAWLKKDDIILPIIEIAGFTHANSGIAQVRTQFIRLA